MSYVSWYTLHCSFVEVWGSIQLARAASGKQYGYNAFNKSEPETPNTHLSHSARRTSNVTKPSVGIFPNESEVLLYKCWVTRIFARLGSCVLCIHVCVFIASSVPDENWSVLISLIQSTVTYTQTSANCTHSTIDQRQNKPTTPPTTESGYTPVILYWSSFFLPPPLFAHVNVYLTPQDFTIWCSFQKDSFFTNISFCTCVVVSSSVWLSVSSCSCQWNRWKAHQPQFFLTGPASMMWFMSRNQKVSDKRQSTRLHQETALMPAPAMTLRQFQKVEGNRLKVAKTTVTVTIIFDT